MSRVHIGPFQVIRTLSDRGGMAHVFLARLSPDFIAKNPSAVTGDYPEWVVIKLQRTDTNSRKRNENQGLEDFYINRLNAEVETLEHLNRVLDARDNGDE